MVEYYDTSGMRRPRRARFEQQPAVSPLPAEPAALAKFVHLKDDADTGPTAHHHTVGKGPHQAAPGNLAVYGWELEVVTDTFEWRRLPGLKGVLPKVVGGGGSGGGAAVTAGGESSCGSGGQGGAYAESIIPVDLLPETVMVTVGGGGLSAAGGTGASGGTSSFGTLVVAPGGSPGAVMPAGAVVPTRVGGGFGVQAITGQIAVPGGSGENGLRITATVCAAGGAGESLLSSRQRGTISVNSIGSAGFPYGGGGSGAASGASQAARAGGAGANGVVILYYLF